jgi:hypothetical protein
MLIGADPMTKVPSGSVRYALLETMADEAWP